MQELEGKRVRGPNGEMGRIVGGQLVVDAPAPAPLRQVVAPQVRQPAPQTPTQSALDSARLGQVPLENEQKLTSIQSSRHSIESSDLTNAGSIRKQFEAMQPVQDYRVVLPQYVSAIQAADNQAGDLQLVYAFGKVMDPGSVVREGELDMAQSTGGLSERIKGYVSSIQGGARLTPEIRQGLLREIRSRAHNIAQQYNQIRDQYKGIAQRGGFSEEDIVGPHPGGPFQQAEADFVGRPITNLDGSRGAIPTRQREALDPEGIGDIGFNQPGDALPPHAQEAQRALQREITEGRVRTAEEIVAFGKKYGLNTDPEEARRAAESIAKGVMPQVATPQWEDIDISSQRGKGGASETADAVGRGIADVPTLGMADEIAAIGDTIFNGGTFRHNLARERRIDLYDQEHHRAARVSGQLAGGLVLPMGEVRSAANLAMKGGAYGAGYGFGSGEGNIGDRGVNALLDGAAGAAGSYAIGAATPYIAKGVGAAARKIIGPATPRQNALLQAGAEEGVPLNMSDVFPGTRNTVATLETIPGAAGPVQRGIAAGRDAIEGRVERLGRGGTPRENMGTAVQEAGGRFVQRTNKQASRLYDRARSAAADTSIKPQAVMQVLTGLVRQEAQTPGGTRAGAIIGQYAKAFEKGGPITIDGARRMRSELLSRLRDDGGLSKAEATRITGQIMGGINDDIERSLTAAGKQGAVRYYRQADRYYAQSRDEIERVTEKFIGTDARPKSAEETLSALQSAMGPKGNSEALGGMLRRLTVEERKDFAATLAESLGRASTEEPFSPALFISGIRKISPASRRLLFGRDGEQSIQNLIRLSNAKKETVRSLNNSRSGQVGNFRNVFSTILFGLPGGGAVAGMAAAGSTGAAGGFAIGAAGIGLSRALSKALMNERFTRLLAQTPATTNPRAIDAHIGRMRQLAARDPNVRAVVESLERQLLGSLAPDNGGGQPNDDNKRQK